MMIPLQKRNDDEDTDDEEEDADAMSNAIAIDTIGGWPTSRAWSVCQGSYDYDPVPSLRDGYLSRVLGARKRYKICTKDI